MNDDIDPLSFIMSTEMFQSLQYRLLQFTTGVICLKSTPNGPEYVRGGSVVPVKLKGRYFLLTAGHVVNDLDPSRFDLRIFTDAPGMKREPRSLNTIPFRRSWVLSKDNIIDWGYLEIPELDAKKWENDGLI